MTCEQTQDFKNELLEIAKKIEAVGRDISAAAPIIISLGNGIEEFGVALEKIAESLDKKLENSCAK